MDNVRFLPDQHFDFSYLRLDGLVLDLGGGGEGVIGKVAGRNVVAIDSRLDELEETNNDAIKVVMDATCLQFVSSTFDCVTAFFTFMYIDPRDRINAIKEAKRVLKPGGRLIIWDVKIAPWETGNEDIIAVRVTVKLAGGEEINTGYGVPWAGREQDLAYYSEIATESGFSVDVAEECGSCLRLELVKQTESSVE